MLTSTCPYCSTPRTGRDSKENSGLGDWDVLAVDFDKGIVEANIYVQCEKCEGFWLSDFVLQITSVKDTGFEQDDEDEEEGEEDL